LSVRDVSYWKKTIKAIEMVPLAGISVVELAL
jgi:hypothetical protein